MALLTACTAEVWSTPSREPSPTGTVGVTTPDGGGGARDAGEATEPTVAFVQPEEGASFARDGVAGHEWAADVMLKVDAAHVDRVEYRIVGGAGLATVDAAPWEALGQILDEGELTLVAVGLSAAGDEVARDEVGIVVGPPTDPSCPSLLDALGLEYELADPTRGIEEPVRLAPVIRGVAFRYLSNDTPTAMLMDCSLAPRLAELTDLLVPHGIDEVIHLGIYNYRCIGGGDPDSGTCTPSQHAYAKAIDIHAFGVEGSDAVYSTETDWVIRADAEVCPGMPANEADRILHELACRMWADGIFHVVLTPDYNEAHRNHFHVDITEGSMFIGDSVTGVDPLVPGLGH